MSFSLKLSSSQSDFNARTGGSCWGITFLFCMESLKSGALTALASMLKERSTVAAEAEAMMKRQGEILATASPNYVLGVDSKPETDLATAGGFQNQNLAIQTRHTAVGVEVKLKARKCIGTLSSFFEGGAEELAQQILRLFKTAGIAAAQIGLQGAGSHSVALSWDGTQLFFFDPNDGVFVADSVDKAASWLGARFGQYKFIYAHVYK
jgi:hypothetical protein